MIRRSSPFWAVMVALATLAFCASPLLVPDFGGFEAGQFPIPQENAPVQPAGYAFSIWGVIYVWLLVSAGFGLFARARASDWQPMRPALTLSLAFGAAWLPVALLSPLGASVLIWMMLIAVLAALQQAPVLDRWLCRAPVALYAGWLTAASCVSIGLLLAGYGLTGQTEAAVLALLLALIITAFVLHRIGDIAEYGFAVIWALIAVAVAGWNDAGIVVWLAATGAALIAGVALAAARSSQTS